MKSRSRTKLLVPIVAAVIVCVGCDERDTQIRSYSVPKEEPPIVPAAQAPVPTIPSGTMEWSLPAGWTSVANTNPVRYATLRAGTGDQQIDVSITQLSGFAGGIAANINRWRGQVGLPRASDEELAANAQRIAAEAPGLWVDLIGSSRMFAAIFPFSLIGIAQPALRSMMANRVPEDAQGELQGAVGSLMSLTMIVSPLIMTQLFGYFSSDAAALYFPGASFFAAGLLGLFAIALFLRAARREPG